MKGVRAGLQHPQDLPASWGVGARGRGWRTSSLSYMLAVHYRGPLDGKGRKMYDRKHGEGD